MKITVDLNEFWNEDGDEATISESIKSAIFSKVQIEVMQSIKTKVDDQITREVKNVIEQEYCLQIRGYVQKAIKEIEMPDPNNRAETISIEDYTRHLFTKSTGWNEPAKVMEKLASSFGKELKDRYDAMFATQIVLKMSENGLLKDGMKELLIESGK